MRHAAHPHRAEALVSPARPEQDPPLVRPDTGGAGARQGRAPCPTGSLRYRPEVGRGARGQLRDRHDRAIGGRQAQRWSRASSGPCGRRTARGCAQRGVAEAGELPALWALIYAARAIRIRTRRKPWSGAWRFDADVTVAAFDVQLGRLDPKRPAPPFDRVSINQVAVRVLRESRHSAPLEATDRQIVVLERLLVNQADAMVFEEALSDGTKCGTLVWDHDAWASTWEACAKRARTSSIGVARSEGTKIGRSRESMDNSPLV